MKSKLFVFGLILVLGVIIGSYQSANADTPPLDASIDMVGKVGAHSSIILTHISATPTFTAQWFNFNPQYAKEMLAVALSAVSLGKNVKVTINDAGNTINSIRILNK